MRTSWEDEMKSWVRQRDGAVCHGVRRPCMAHCRWEEGWHMTKEELQGVERESRGYTHEKRAWQRCGCQLEENRHRD